VKRKRIVYVPLLLLCVLWLGAIPAAAQIVDRTDNQFWSDVQFAVPVTKNFDFNVLGTLRLGRDITHAVDERIGAGFTFRYGKYLSVSPNYLHIGTQPFERRRAWENRLSLPVQLRFNAGRFRITDRNLFERRFRNSGLKSTRYRQRLQVDHPLGEKDWQLSLYVADEVFYDWAIDRWVRNRFTVGVIKVFNKHFQEDFYYLRQNDGVSVPGDLNVIGTSLRFRL
jgi:hypothetical protein